jgi:hypothetical protein
MYYIKPKIHKSNGNNGNARNSPRTDGQRNFKQTGTGMLCQNCKLTNHITDDCKWLGQPKCTICNWSGHTSENCRRHLKRKREEDGGGPKKKPKPDQVNIATESGLEEEISFTADEADDNCNTYSVENNDSMILYFWLADSATTSHVANKRDFFEMFTPLRKTVLGVGNAQTSAKGKGTIRIKTKIKEKEHHLLLTDVLYIPTNKHNLLSLG